MKMEEMELLPPPSYGSLVNEHRSGLSYIDFLPTVPGTGFVIRPECERFGTLIDGANEWLRLNPQWEVNTCESMEFEQELGGINPSKMFYYRHSRQRCRIIRGLRLWLKSFPPGKERVQRIGYVNLVPGIEIQGGMMTSSRHETLDDVLLKFNNASRMTPLPGRIITIETQEMKPNAVGAIDPDRNLWTEYSGVFDQNRPQCAQYVPLHTLFVYTIRIFYEIGEPLYEEIGMTDFIPTTLGTTCFGMHAYYETFSTLFEKASRWCSCQSDLRICNMQSLKVPNGVSNRTMSYSWSWSYRASFMRILRVAHIRQQPEGCASTIQFSYKTFVPKQLQQQRSIMSCFQPSFETLQETMNRVSNWIQANGADILSVETCAVPLKSDGAYSSSEDNGYSEMNVAMYCIFVIRVYMKGSNNESESAIYEDTSSTSYFNFRFLCILISILCILPILIVLILILLLIFL